MATDDDNWLAKRIPFLWRLRWIPTVVGWGKLALLVFAALTALATWFSSRMNPVITYPLVASCLAFFGILGIGRELKLLFERRPPIGPPLIAPTPKSRVPIPANFEEWDRLPVLTIGEAAALWKELEPSTADLDSEKILPIRAALKRQVDIGEMEITQPVTGEFNLAAKLSFGPPPAVDATLVSRDALTKFATSLGEKPQFLFPEGRQKAGLLPPGKKWIKATPPTVNYADWNHIDPIKLWQAAELWVGKDPVKTPAGGSDEAYPILLWLKQQILAGKLRPSLPINTSVLLSGDAENISGDTTVFRLALRACAEERNETPAFLFENRRKD